MRKTACFFTLAALVATIFSACGPNNMNTDGGMPMDDGGMPPDSDAGMLNPDGGDTPDGNVMNPDGGGDVCHPSETNLTCEGASDCECVMGAGIAGFCDAMDPSRTGLCAPGPGRFECIAGVSNRCDFSLPMRMESYDPAPFLATGCLDYVDADRWNHIDGPSVDEGGSGLSIENGMHILFLSVGAASTYIFTCGNEGKCWYNWPNADNPDPSVGVHARLTIDPSCTAITADFFNPGEYDTPSYTEIYNWAGPR